MSIPRHPNTICTHCHIKPIVGILYHCVTCRYKLCEICFRYDATCTHVSQAWKTPFQEQLPQQWQQDTPKLMSLQSEFVTNQFKTNPFSFIPRQTVGTNFSFNTSFFNQITEMPTGIEEGEDGDGAMIIQSNNVHDTPNPIGAFSF